MPASPSGAVTGRLIGYARVSTDEQGTDPQVNELRAAGCAAVHEEHASGADRGRPVLAQLLRAIRPGDTLVVVRLDRLARSVSHLLAVIEHLEARGAHFRSLRDPIDTTTPQGVFSLQVLGAVAQLERVLLDPAPRKPAGDRLMVLVAGIATAAPGYTLQQIAAQLEAMRERTPRGGTRWHPSSVRNLLQRAKRLGLVGAPAAPRSA